MAMVQPKIKEPKFLDISKFLGRGRNLEKGGRVYRVGIELEGGWDKLPPGIQLTHDGSVQINAPGSGLTPEEQVTWQGLRDSYRAGLITPSQMRTYEKLEHKRVTPTKMQRGELPSPPIEVESIEEWMKIHYPHHVNHTCGMHVHMSFRSALTYQRLMHPDFSPTVVEFIKRWAEKEGLDSHHPIWPRLSGKSVYCQHKFWADKQARHKGAKGHDQHTPGHRYTVINYCYGRFQTIECRLLPMMEKVDVSVRAIKELIFITNGFLLATAQKEAPFKGSVLIEDDLFKDEVREFLA